MSCQKLFLIIFSLFLLAAPLDAQYGGLGFKFNLPNYALENHPNVTDSFTSLYLSFRLGKGMTLFADTYLLKTDGEPFDTGLRTPMESSNFSDRVTVLGLMYHHKLPFFKISAYGGAGFGWHSLRIGYAENMTKETSKNYGAHGIFGLEYDLRFIPVVIFAEGRYAKIFLREEDGDPKFTPSALHAGGTITLTAFSIGTLIYFF